MKIEEHLKEIWWAGLEAVDPEAAIRRSVRIRGDCLEIAGQVFELAAVERIFIVGFGKASTAMGRGLEAILAPLVDAGKKVTGLLITKHGHDRFADLQEVSRIFRVAEASHPLPDQAGVDATHSLLELVSSSREKDLVICLISGGGSALLCHPQDGISLEDKGQTTQALLECGASIHEINTLRKHISRVKGGRLAEAFSPSRSVALILSDVVGDDLSAIASGPTYPDDSTFADAVRILEKYQIRDRLPQTVFDYLKAGVKGEVPETLEAESPAFESVSNTIIGSNVLACRAAELKSLELGYNTLVLSDCLEGEARECAVFHAGIARSVAESGLPVKKPGCVISGGENTVTLKGSGLGGRNQEFCLAIIPWISRLREVGFLSAGTDGNDGPTDAAGGIVTHESLDRAISLGLDVEQCLRNNDSYHFLEKLGALFKTGPTNTNVMDLRIMLVRQSPH